MSAPRVVRKAARMTSARKLFEAHLQAGETPLVMVWSADGKLRVEESECSPATLDAIARGLRTVARLKRADVH